MVSRRFRLASLEVRIGEFNCSTGLTRARIAGIFERLIASLALFCPVNIGGEVRYGHCSVPRLTAAATFCALHRTARFHRLQRPAILRRMLLTHVAFRPLIQQVAGELVTSGIVHSQGALAK